MFLSYQSLPLEAINVTDIWNLHPWELLDVPYSLSESLLRTGIIHPPLVIQKSKGRFAVISGCKRLEFARRSVDLDRIDCGVIKQDASHQYLLDLILDDQNNASSLSLAEKARFIEISCRFLSTKHIVDDYLPRLGFEKRATIIPKLRKILTEDELFIKKIHTGQIQEKMVMELLNLPKKTDRLALVNLFLTLALGNNKQKKIFTLIRNIAFRKRSSIAAYLQQEGIQAILRHGKMNIPQKVHHLNIFLQQTITPSLHQAEQGFEKKIKELQLPANHTISHSPFFEKDTIKLSIIFKNFSDCRQYLRKNSDENFIG